MGVIRVDDTKTTRKLCNHDIVSFEISVSMPIIT